MSQADVGYTHTSLRVYGHAFAVFCPFSRETSLAIPRPTPLRSRSRALTLVCTRFAIPECSRIHTRQVIDNKLMATLERTANVGAIQSYVDDNFRSP